jgi:sulfate adenylyltransferase (EC 2.7.7.4)
MSENNSIKAHGGVLINRITKLEPTGLFSITITEDLANDVENIADGIFSPLEGFFGGNKILKVLYLVEGW